MLERLKTGPKVVGIKQVLRALQEEKALCVFVAQDAEERVVRPVKALCTERNVPLETASSMTALGSACGISVGSAAAALLR
jgi:large subunit ribosomal protein L7A